MYSQAPLTVKLQYQVLKFTPGKGGLRSPLIYHAAVDYTFYC